MPTVAHIEGAITGTSTTTKTVHAQSIANPFRRLSDRTRCMSEVSMLVDRDGPAKAPGR
jgi:hypothetical protein